MEYLIALRFQWDMVISHKLGGKLLREVHNRDVHTYNLFLRLTLSIHEP